MARKASIVGGLLSLLVVATIPMVAPITSADASPHSLRCRIVKRTPSHVVIKHVRPHLRLVLRRTQRSIRVHGGRYQVVKRTHKYVLLRVRDGRKPKPTVPPLPAPTPTPTPTVSPTPTSTPSATATPTATPSPTVTPTPTATPSPTVTPTPTPSPLAAHPSLILTSAGVEAIRQRIAAKTQPEYGAYATFLTGRVATAMCAAPNVYPGPFTGPDTDAARPVFDRLGGDGSKARDVGIAYAFTGDAKYALKARQILVAWANGNQPTTITDYDSKDTGQLQSYGAFSFAYAYDLTLESGAYSASDRVAIEAWFRRFADALQTCLRPTLTDYFFLHPDTTDMKGAYEWAPTMHYSKYDALIVGADFPMLMQAASLAMAHLSGDTALEQRIMNDAANPLNIEKILASALTPHNDGDGAGTALVPQEKIYKSYSAGRGGMLDYMTYNTRVCDVLVEMAANLGWSSAKTASGRAKLHTSWSYMARYFGPNALPNFNPTDVVHLDSCLPRFALAWHDFGDPRFMEVLTSGPRDSYYEPQLLGPVTLTHTIVGL